MKRPFLHILIDRFLCFLRNLVQTKITSSSERLSVGVFICSAPDAFGGIARNDAMLSAMLRCLPPLRDINWVYHTGQRLGQPDSSSELPSKIIDVLVNKSLIDRPCRVFFVRASIAVLGPLSRPLAFGY